MANPKMIQILMQKEGDGGFPHINIDFFILFLKLKIVYFFFLNLIMNNQIKEKIFLSPKIYLATACIEYSKPRIYMAYHVDPRRRIQYEQ